MEKSGTIIVILVVAVVAWMLLNKTSATVAKVNTSVRQTYTAGTAAAAVITQTAPALGSFLSNVLKSSPSSSSTAFSDDTQTNSFTNPGVSTAFSDDSIDFAAQGYD